MEPPLPPDVIALVELVFERLDAGAGDWTLQFFASDGHVRKWQRQQNGGRDDLASFDPPQ